MPLSTAQPQLEGQQEGGEDELNRQGGILKGVGVQDGRTWLTGGWW